MIWTLIISKLKKYLPVLILSVVAILQFYIYRKEHTKVTDFRQLQKVQQQELKTWRDKAGKNRARAEIAEINAENAKLVLSKELKTLIKREVGNLKRNLISYSNVKATTKGSIHSKAIDTVYSIDSLSKPIPTKQFKIDNPDLKFRGNYFPSLDSLIADYKVKHNFELFYYYKKSGKAPWNLFRRKKAVAEIKFQNHGSQADSLFTVVMKRKKGFLRRILGKN